MDAEHKPTAEELEALGLTIADKYLGEFSTFFEEWGKRLIIEIRSFAEQVDASDLSPTMKQAVGQVMFDRLDKLEAEMNKLDLVSCS